MLEEDDRNLIVAKIFCIQLYIAKSLWRPTFQSLCYMYVFFVLYWAVFDLRR